MKNLRSNRLLDLLWLIVAIAVLVSSAGEAFAAYNVAISGAASANGSWSGGNPDVWTPSGSGAKVSVSEIQTRLNGGTSVTINTGAGGTENGDITVLNALSWSAGALDLEAAQDIRVDAVMTASGTSSLTLTSESGAVMCAFGPGGGFRGRVDFDRAGAGFLTINGLGYTVLNSLGAPGSTTCADLQGISGCMGDNFALGADINALPTSDWNSGAGFLPLGPVFGGLFDGLGHVISDLTINRPSTDYVGLFAKTDGHPHPFAPALIGNVGLAAGSVTGRSYAGSLVGSHNFGAMRNVFNTCSVSAGNSYAGGLAGNSNMAGSIRDSWNGGTVSAVYRAGGLISGMDMASITGSYNTGAISGGGGLTCHTASSAVGVGDSFNAGSADQSGLVSGNYGLIDKSFNSGSVGGGTSAGLVLNNYSGGAVTNSFWDAQTSGQLHSSGSPDSCGKTTAQMKQLATFTAVGWDIDDAGGTGKIWRIYDTHTYPLLRTFLTPLTVTANNDTRPYTGVPYSGGNGVAYSPAGYDPGHVSGSVAYGGTSQGATAVGSYTIVPSGLWSDQQGYDIAYASGTLTILSAVVGRVPEGAPGTPLTVAKNGGQLNLAWGASCGSLATDYAVYEGTIGSWYSHGSLACTTGGATSATVTPSSGYRYYLVVPQSGTQEGSYGTRTGGTEIPQGSSPCKATQDLGACP